jgi:hypothetical protein
MPKIPLIQGSYLARGLIANAQSCINIFAEPNPKDAPFPMTHYPGSGTSVLSDFTGIFSGTVRGLYVASDGTVYAVIGQNVIRWLGAGNTNTSYYQLGNLPSNTGNPVVMCDNQLQLVIVDGSANGWTVNLPGQPGGLQQISDPAFYGGNRVDFIDTFLIFNRPQSTQFYSTTSETVTPFNPLYFAAKEGWNDYLISIAALHDNIWLLGAQTTEIWFNSGASDFPWQRMPNSVIQQGCVAAYSAIVADNSLYWLSQDRWGRNFMMRGQGYAATRVSNFAVENEWADYPAVSDCIGMAYQQAGHEIAGFLFPTANAWWGYDATSGQWHKRAYGDTSTAWLPYCTAFWGTYEQGAEMGTMLAGDRTAPRILQIARSNYTDCGTPIIRQRSWPSVLNDEKRLAHTQFAASFDGSALQPDTVNLAWSDDAGHTFGAPVPQTVLNQTNGQYSWRRLGYGRQRVYQLQWQGAGDCALNGAWIEVQPQAT